MIHVFTDSVNKMIEAIKHNNFWIVNVIDFIKTKKVEKSLLISLSYKICF